MTKLEIRESDDGDCASRCGDEGLEEMRTSDAWREPECFDLIKMKS